MALDERQGEILRAVVREYVRVARPVGSEALARKYRIGVSPATIRNEFAELTQEGYLRKPHTSAGRTPTNRGYRYFVNVEVRPERSIDQHEAKQIKDDVETLAEMLSNCSELLSAVWREDNETALRGLKQILAQPEFAPRDASLRLAETIDALPQTLAKLFELDVPAGVFIGDESPLWKHDDISILFRRVRFSNRACGIACIIGPTRMSYETNWELLA
jgi:transcriptional regulator of heat shock response